MKVNFLFTTLMVMALGLNLTAQDVEKEKLTPEKRAEVATTQMKVRLDLSDEQTAKVKAVQTDHFKKVEKNLEEMRAHREVMDARMKKQTDETDAELKKILTEEQFKKYQEKKENRKEKMEKRREKKR